MTFPTQIQHVVVIYMENRTVDNLFAGLYSQTFSGGETWGTALNLKNPAAQPTLLQYKLGKNLDPNHEHDGGWYYESQGQWQNETFGCQALPCPKPETPLAYVEPSQIGIYQQLIRNWAFANNVLEANQGPSFISHQYGIAAQSGGLVGASSSPNAEGNNPHASPNPVATGDYVETGNDVDMMMKLNACDPNNADVIKTINMSIAQPSPSMTPWDNGTPLSPPCSDYNTILDEINNRLGAPPVYNWQYLAHATNSIWAAPLGVDHLYQGWESNPSNYPFFVDPDAEQFVANLQSQNPTEPFAALTYITPCGLESDHPEPIAQDVVDGPEWLAWVINAIGESKYWDSTAIIVTWDDWAAGTITFLLSLKISKA